MRSQILHGKTWHCRYTPQRHAFTYPMTWLCVDLDELPTLNQTVRLFGHNRQAAFSIRDSDYVGRDAGALRDKVMHLLAREGMGDGIERIDLVTLPRVFGYAFNPVSFFRCYASNKQLAVLVAEVRNTFGEKHHYVLRPSEVLESTRFHCTKAFYVSPFNRVEGEYEVRWREQAGSLWLEIDLRRAGEVVMTAGMQGQFIPLTSRSLMRSAVRLPLQVAAVVPRITWQALKLYLGKRAALIAKPDPSHAATIAPLRISLFDRVRAFVVSAAARQQHTSVPISPALSFPKEDAL